jgi:hypothetical protein
MTYTREEEEDILCNGNDKYSNEWVVLRGAKGKKT